MSNTQRRDVFIGTTGKNDHPAFFSASMENNFYKLKVVLVGDMSVGKTALAIRFTKDKFDEHHHQTIGASFISKVVHSNDDVISFQIWDTAGQERYKSLVPMYLRGAHIALVIYDVTDPESFANIGVWLDALHHHGDLAKAILVANKCDLESTVGDTTAVEFAQANGLQFVKTSAKTGYNVEKLFNTIGSKVVGELKRIEKDKSLARTSLYDIPLTVTGTSEDRDTKKKHCCKS